MSVEVVAGEVEVNTLTMTANYVFNTVFHTLSRLVQERGLALDYLTDNRKIIEDGIFIWVTESTLLTLVLEIFHDGTDQALERFDFLFTYRADPTMNVKAPPIDNINKFCKTLRTLPPHARYRVVVTLKPGAAKVPGWAPTEFRKLNVTNESEQGDWGFGNAGIRLVYKGGTW